MSTQPKAVRLPAELVERIDALRGLVPREAFVRDTLTWAVRDLEHGKAKFEGRKP